MPAHRAFLIVSLALCAVTGTGLGLWLLVGWLGWLSLPDLGVLLSAHAQFQVYGFVALFTMGVSLMMLPSVLKTPLRPAGMAPLSLLLMLAGIGANLSGPSWLGALLQTASTLAFLGVVRSTRQAAPQRKPGNTRLQRGHALFLASGSLWLLACPGLSLVAPTRALENVLWGFAGLYIAGMGLRLHTGILGLKSVREGLLVPSALVWNLGLGLRWLVAGPLWSWVLALGVGLYLLALRPFRRSFIPAAGGAWLRLFVRTSYAWLMVAVILTCLTESGRPYLAGAARHAVATGFVLTMIMGMGLRMVPAFEMRRLVWKSAPWAVYALMTVGTLVRVAAQAGGLLGPMAWGGALQALAVWAFALTLSATCLWGESAKEHALALYRQSQ